MTRTDWRSIATLLTILSLSACVARARQTPPAGSDEPCLRPYVGPTRGDVDATTLDGKVLCGYQGWFNTPGDGSGFSFVHWGQGLERPGGGRFTVDLWPDVSEYDPRDLCDVPGLEMPDGSPAQHDLVLPGCTASSYRSTRFYPTRRRACQDGLGSFP
jgi:hypothetical protein